MGKPVPKVKPPVKKMRKPKAKAKPTPKIKPKPKPKLSKLDMLKNRAKELQLKATAARKLAYRVQRTAAVTYGTKQQAADWKAEQEKTVAGFMQSRADDARSALNTYLAKMKAAAAKQLASKKKQLKTLKKTKKKAKKI